MERPGLLNPVLLGGKVYSSLKALQKGDRLFYNLILLLLFYMVYFGSAAVTLQCSIKLISISCILGYVRQS